MRRSGSGPRTIGLVGAALAGAGAWLAWPGVVPAAGPAGPGDCVTIYAVSNGFHTGLALPADAAARAGLPTGGAAWVEVGWGEARAYQAPRLSLGTALGAVFAPGPTTLFVAPLRDHPQRLWREGIVPVSLSQQGLGVLAGELSAEAARDPAGRTVVLSRRRGAWFLAGRSPYRFWRTCNVWTAERLRRAGVEVRDRPSIFAPALMRRLERTPACPGPSR